MIKSALIIFIKNAEKGKVKTRLASTLGDDKALQIYQALMSHTRQLTLQVPVNRLLFYSNFINLQDDWRAADFKKYVQEGADLGARIEKAFETAFQQHQKVIIIGSDCASLTPAIIQEAFDQLDKPPFVVGPAVDGGYYLLGMTQFTPSLFKQMPWSTDAVLPTTLSRIKALGKDCFLLPELSDIDHEEDWERYGWKL